MGGVEAGVRIGMVDTEHGINTAIRKIRLTLGDNPEAPQFVQTVSGSGYRFVAPVNAVQTEFTKQPPPSPDPVAVPPEPAKTPSVSVAPSLTKGHRRLWLVSAVCVGI